MSAPLGKYHFLAWARRGVGSALGNKDGGSLPSRGSLSVQLALDVQQGATDTPVSPTPTTVQVYGPGDVTGVDPRYVIRTEPRNFTVNFEPNYLCGIEFDSPDFPWLFTPAAPNGDRLRPWVALIVLKDGEYTAPSVAPNPLPVIDVSSLAALSDLSESWNWAHVQVSGDTALADAMDSAPGTVSSRLLCPRRLDPETGYHAFLVPAFEIGRQVGVGKDVSAVATADPAWTSQTAVPLRLPYYYTFEFHTSDEGDFESLVRKLTPRVLPPTVGKRPMDVSQPMISFPSAGAPLGLEGALYSVGTTSDPWSGTDKNNFQDALQAFVNLNTPTTDDPAHPNPQDPQVVPPLYGQWHAAIKSVDKGTAGWMEDLNLDPRNRSGAGMGTQVVQGERTQLLASAWQQVAGVIKANQLLKQAQLARAALQQVYNQRLEPAVPETLTVFTAPLHKKLLASPTTVLFAIRQSLLPERLFSSVFRRVSRPRRRLSMVPGALNQLISKVNSGQISIVPPLQQAPGGMVPIGQISNQATPAWLTWLLDLFKKYAFLRIALPLLLLLVIVVIGLAAGWPAALGALAASVAAVAALAKTLQNARAADQLRPTNLTPQAVAQIPPRPNFQITAPGTAPPTGTAGTTDSAQALAFRGATKDLFTAIQAAPGDPAPKPALNLEGLKPTLLARLDPDLTVPKRMQSLVNLSSRLPWKAVDPLEPIMAAPEFPQPMAVPLAALSQQYLLPGVDQIQPDTLGLLEANHAFIEAYMVGLNHEMARQLLWNGYPTDQRGSYFRQFWDVSAYVPQPGDPTDPTKLTELLKDIPPVNTWPLPPGLGQHPNRTDIVPNNLVLLVRGELFKRYPNAVVYAGKAKRLSDGTRVLDETDERYPIFRMTLTPDMTFLGFNLSAADAKGGTPASPEGFFFVFQEQPSEPRFGLEPSEDANPITHWAELSWTNFTGGNEGFQLPNLGKTKRAQIISNNPWRLASQAFGMTLASSAVPDFLSPAGQLHRTAIVAGNPADPDYSPDDPSNKWGVNSAQTAYVLLRLPFRILVHADLMLPS